MSPTYKQLELDLWGDLKTALKEPESADMKLLWQGLDQAIAHSDSNKQLLVAGDAIAQIVEVYVKRAKGVLDSLEATDNSQGPVLDEDFLSGLMRQSMSIDLSDLMEEFPFDEVESSSVNVGSQVALIDRKEARAIARQERARMRKALKDLAEKENIPQWQQAIALWIGQHRGEKVSLLQLQQALGMPLVEVWLGLLHSPTLYRWENRKSFTLRCRMYELAIGKMHLLGKSLSLETLVAARYHLQAVLHTLSKMKAEECSNAR